MTDNMARGGWNIGRRRGASTGARRPAAYVEPLEPRVVLSGVSATYSVTQNWGSGFQAAVTLQNTGPSAVSNWTLEFDTTATLSSVWDGVLASRSGNHYVVRNAGWNGDIPSGGSVSFGYVAGPGGAPTNYLLNGQPLGAPIGPVLPGLDLADASTLEGDSGKTDLAFQLSLSRVSPIPVTVNYATTDGTARAGAGSDYLAATGSVTFAPGETSKTVLVQVLGDTTVEPDETFSLTLSNPSGATLGGGSATGLIRNDDVATPSPSGVATFQILGDWGSGFTGQVSVKNPSTTPRRNWSLSFDFAGQITSIWDARMVSRSGNHYEVSGAGWNDTIPAGGSVSFGFNGTPGGGSAVPSNFMMGGGTTAANRAPIAVNDSAVVHEGQANLLTVLANDSDPDGDPLTVGSLTQPREGTASINPDGTLRYAPRAGYAGPDAFTYTVSDGRGGLSTATVNLNVLPAAGVVWPERVYAPYVDVTLWPTPDLTSFASDQSVNFLTLAFVVADPQNQPSWGGYASYGLGSDFDAGLRARVDGVRSLGGDVMVSFGGANGRELAQAITDPTALKQAYQSVIDAYNLTRLDFDIEGGAAAEKASIDRRSAAMAALQRDAIAAGRPLQIWLTLPVLPTGLTADGLYVVQSAVKAGVDLAGVNIMAMDYGDSAAPNPAGKMGDYAIQAATSTQQQLKGVYGASKTDGQLWAMIGVTPMIGLNDVTTEVFDPQEASEVVAFARQHGLKRLSIWSLNRDRANSSGAINHVEPTSSSLAQTPYEFSRIFLPFQN